MTAPPDPTEPAEPLRRRWWVWALATVALALAISCSGVALLLLTQSRAGAATASAGGLTVVVRGPGGVSAVGGAGGPVITATVGGRPVTVTPAAVAVAGAAPIPLPAGTRREELSTALLSGRLSVCSAASAWPPTASTCGPSRPTDGGRPLAARGASRGNAAADWSVLVTNPRLAPRAAGCLASVGSSG